MKLRVLALAGLLALPSLAAAQSPVPDPRQLPRSRFAVTPFVGVQVPYSGGDQFIITESGTPWAIREQRAGGPLVGVEGEAHLWGPLGVLGSVAYANSGDTHATLLSVEGDVVPIQLSGPDTWFGRLALSYRLPEPSPDNRRFHPAGFLVAGPALVRIDYDDEEYLQGEASQAVNNWGVNVGFHAVSTFGSPRVALHLGLEDFVTFWDTDRLARRDEALFGILFDEATVVEYNYSTSNILTLRAGLSVRF